MKRLAQLMLTRFFSDSLCVYVSFAHIPSLHFIRHNEYEQFIYFFGNKEDEWMCQGCEMLGFVMNLNIFESWLLLFVD